MIAPDPGVGDAFLEILVPLFAFGIFVIGAYWLIEGIGWLARRVLKLVAFIAHGFQ